MGVGDGIVGDIEETIAKVDVELIGEGGRIGSLDGKSVIVRLKGWELPERIASSVEPDPLPAAVATGT